MPITDKQRLRDFQLMKENPTLAMYQSMASLRAELNETMKVMIEKELARKITEITQIKGDKGNKGDKGEIGLQGKQGSQGRMGFQGVKGERGQSGIDGKNGRDGINGKDGKNGKDGSPDNPKQVRDKLTQLKGDDRLDASAIKNLEKQIGEKVVLMGGDRGRRDYPRTCVPTGTMNGVNDRFTLPSQAKPDTIKVFVNGMRQREGSAYVYTVSSDYTHIVFNANSIPQEGWELICDYSEDR